MDRIDRRFGAGAVGRGSLIGRHAARGDGGRPAAPPANH